MEALCVKQNNSPAASLLFDMSYVGSRVVGSYLFTMMTSFLLDTLLGIVISSMHTDLVTHSAHEPSNHDRPHLYNSDGQRDEEARWRCERDQQD
jgi:hypothetical protein